jgi:DUF4097 and DUF4098 domain-containing protein YvlB
MRLTLTIPALAAGLLFLTACDVADWGHQERFTRDFHYGYPLEAGGRVSVETFNGSVEVSGWDESSIDISGTKYANSQQAADDLKIEIDHTPGSVSIRVPRPSYERRNRQGARFVIKVPRTAVLDRIVSSNGSIRTLDCAGPAKLRTSNGAIHVEGMRGGGLDIQTSNGAVELLDVEGDVVAHTSNGHVRADIVRAAGSLRVETSNGGIDLRLPTGFNSQIRADTSNGGITVRLPADINARVSARTSNSSITSDFEVNTQGEVKKHSIDGVIGAGGPMIDLSTSNGGIRLLKM